MDSKTYARSILLSFQDYRKFLNAFVDYCCKRQRGFSLNRLSRALGFRSSSSLLKVLSGDRPPSRRLIENLCVYLDLRSEQANYLREIFAVGRLTKDTHGKVGTKSLTKAIGKNFLILPIDQCRLLADVLSMTIIEMSVIKGFVPDADWIQTKLRGKHSKSRIRMVLAFLQNRNFLGAESSGIHIEVMDGEQPTVKTQRAEMINRLNLNFLVAAQEAVKGSRPDKIYRSGSIFKMSSRNIKKAIEALDRYHDEISKLLTNDDGPDVYAFAMQFFPMTKSSSAG